MISKNASAKKLRILIADDHDVLRRGLDFIISREKDWEVCGLAKTGREALEKSAEVQPDVAVLDLGMPDLGGVELVREMRRRFPKIELVIFSGQKSENVIKELFDAGARSFVQKADASDLLVKAIKAAAQHRPFFTAEISKLLFSRFMTSDVRTHGEDLTPREREIIRYVAEGKSNKEIAAELGISLRTVETHRAAFMRKLGISSTADTVRYAIRNSIIEA
jgi:two-component system response regulator NreC